MAAAAQALPPPPPPPLEVALGLLRVVINRAMAMVTRLFHQPSHNIPHVLQAPLPPPTALLSRFPYQLENLLCTNHAVHRPGVIFAGEGLRPTTA